jgi:selenocysteine lyase/cysteine desulfurase
MTAYFNNAGLARTHPSVTARMREADAEFAGMLYSEAGVPHYYAIVTEARRAAAALLGVDGPGGISLNSNASMGVNLALSVIGATLKAGDIVVTSDQEHPCVVLPLRMLARLRGVEIVALAADSAANFIAQMRTAIARRPALVILSHVSYKNGRILPVEEIGKLLAEHEIPYIVDGAQAVGQLRVYVPATRAWAYIFAGHKWLGGPMGTGGIWTGPDFVRRNDSIPTIWDEAAAPPNGGRFECGTMNIGLIAGLAEACHSCLTALDDRIATFARMRTRVTDQIDGVWTNASAQWDGPCAPGIVTYLMPPGIHSWEVAAEILARRDVAVKPFRPEECIDAIRVSFSPLTTDDEIERLLHAIADYATG